MCPKIILKFNGVLTYSQGDASQGFSATAMGYHGTWNATNQVPELAVAEGLVTRFGSMNPTDGGLTDRYTLSGEWHQADEHSATKILAYAYYYNMGLWNDFTYFLDDPVQWGPVRTNGHPVGAGGESKPDMVRQWCGMAVENTFGLDIRNDVIHDGLFHTEDRTVLSTIRVDNVVETDVAPYFENKIQWLPKFRTVVGLPL